MHLITGHHLWFALDISLIIGSCHNNSEIKSEKNKTPNVVGRHARGIWKRRFLLWFKQLWSMTCLPCHRRVHKHHIHSLFSLLSGKDFKGQSLQFINLASNEVCLSKVTMRFFGVFSTMSPPDIWNFQVFIVENRTNITFSLGTVHTEDFDLFGHHGRFFFLTMIMEDLWETIKWVWIAFMPPTPWIPSVSW